MTDTLTELDNRIANTPGETAEEFYANLDDETRETIEFSGFKRMVLAAWRAGAKGNMRAQENARYISGVDSGPT